MGLAAEDLPAQQDRSGWPTLRDRLTEAFLARPRQHWTDVFDAIDACVTPVLSFDEASQHAHIVARGVVTVLNSIVQPSPAPRFSRTEAGTPAPPPSHASDAAAVIAEWSEQQARRR